MVYVVQQAKPICFVWCVVGGDKAHIPIVWRFIKQKNKKNNNLWYKNMCLFMLFRLIEKGQRTHTVIQKSLHMLSVDLFFMTSFIAFLPVLIVDILSCHYSLKAIWFLCVIAVHIKYICINVYMCVSFLNECQMHLSLFMRLQNCNCAFCSCSHLSWVPCWCCWSLHCRCISAFGRNKVDTANFQCLTCCCLKTTTKMSPQ